MIFCAADWQGGVEWSGPVCRRDVRWRGEVVDGRVVGCWCQLEKWPACAALRASALTAQWGQMKLGPCVIGSEGAAVAGEPLEIGIE
jgi:hypothetical protein